MRLMGQSVLKPVMQGTFVTKEAVARIIVEILCSSKRWLEFDTKAEALRRSKDIMSSLLW